MRFLDWKGWNNLLKASNSIKLRDSLWILWNQIRFSYGNSSETRKLLRIRNQTCFKISKFIHVDISMKPKKMFNWIFEFQKCNEIQGEKFIKYKLGNYTLFVHVANFQTLFCLRFSVCWLSSKNVKIKQRSLSDSHQELEIYLRFMDANAVFIPNLIFSSSQSKYFPRRNSEALQMQFHLHSLFTQHSSNPRFSGQWL